MSIFDVRKRPNLKDDGVELIYQALKKGWIALDALQSDDVLPLAIFARKQGDYYLALQCLRGFEKSFPELRREMRHYLLAAEIMAVDLGCKAEACVFLEGVLALYPNHNEREKLEAQLALWQKE